MINNNYSVDDVITIKYNELDEFINTFRRYYGKQKIIKIQKNIKSDFDLDKIKEIQGEEWSGTNFEQLQNILDDDSSNLLVIFLDEQLWGSKNDPYHEFFHKGSIRWIKEQDII